MHNFAKSSFFGENIGEMIVTLVETIKLKHSANLDWKFEEKLREGVRKFKSLKKFFSKFPFIDLFFLVLIISMKFSIIFLKWSK